MEILDDVEHAGTSTIATTAYEVQDGASQPSRRWFMDELRTQLVLAGPMIAVNFLEYSLFVVSVMFVGRLGALALASAALATSFTNVTGLSLLMGIGCALETLCGQAFGAKNYSMVGVYMQRGVVVLLLVSIPVTVIWCNLTSILVTLGQAPEIAEKAGEYALFLVPSLFAYAVLQGVVKFLQAQSLVHVMTLSSVVTLLCFHIPITYIMVFRSGLGFRGAAIATSISNWVNVLILTIYVKRSPHCKKTWRGVSSAAFQDLRGLTLLAVPSTAMVCLEWWSFELIVLLSGLLPNPKLETAAITVSFSTTALFFMIPYGVGAVTSIRVSNELGAGNSQGARRAVGVSLCVGVAEAAAVGGFLFSARNWWGWLFTNEAEVVNYVARLMPILASLTATDAMQGILAGVVRGAGWQAFGAVSSLAAYYMVGLPIGIMMAFRFHWNALGFYVGIVSAILTDVTILSVVTACTDWGQQARDAAGRGRRFYEALS